MNLPDLAAEHAKPLEIIHETRWMDALMNRTAAPAVSVPSISSRAGWRTSIAVRADHMTAADDLVSRRYAWRGYRMAPSKAACASREAQGSPRVVLLAQHGGHLMGTLTVRPDSPQGLFAEQSYFDEIHAMRRDGHRLGELVKLAVEEGADWKAALDALVQSAYLITRVVNSLTDVVIEVNPRHVRFYQRVFGFAVAASERFCERVRAPSVLLRLDLEQFGRRLQLAA
jgi:hypothetical protein